MRLARVECYLIQKSTLLQNRELSWCLLERWW